MCVCARGGVDGGQRQYWPWRPRVTLRGPACCRTCCRRVWWRRRWWSTCECLSSSRAADCQRSRDCSSRTPPVLRVHRDRTTTWFDGTCWCTRQLGTYAQTCEYAPSTTSVPAARTSLGQLCPTANTTRLLAIVIARSADECTYDL